MKEKHMQEVTLQDVDSEALKMLIDFCYSSRLHISKENAQRILPLARMLQVEGVVGACSDFLASQLHPSNVLGMHSFADTHSCDVLMSRCNMFLQQRFPEIVLHEEFLQLEYEKVLVIVSNDQLNVRGEEQVYEAVLAWIKHKEEQRKKFLPVLLSHVRMPLMTAVYLSREVKHEPLVMQSFECRGLLIEAMDFHLRKNYLRDGTKSTPAINTTPRRCPGLEHLFAIGGSGSPIFEQVPYLDLCECYDVEKKEWRAIAPLPRPRSGIRVASVGGYVYAIGGFSDRETRALAGVDRYDPMTDSWRSMSPMNLPRRGFAVAVLNNYIYAIGGINNRTYYNTVERYCPRSNQWTMVASMNSERRALGAASLNGYIYAAGGHDGDSLLHTFERYDPNSNMWTLVANLPSHRSVGRLVALKGYLYAVGGYDGMVVVRDVERYDPVTDEWSTVTTLPTQRSGFGAAVIDGILYIVGGMDNMSKLNTIDCFNPETNKWSYVAPMSIKRSGLDVGVATGVLF
jgi:N-acetylneuraminic acid mutarotase